MIVMGRVGRGFWCILVGFIFEMSMYYFVKVKFLYKNLCELKIKV